jgi:hypothetical protein
MPSVDYSTFTWQAFATLTTGFLAVCAATIIALRQIALAKQQTRLSELTLKEKLFDRRFQIYQDVHRSLSSILSDNPIDVDRSPSDDPIDVGTVYATLDDAAIRARFLFDYTVERRLYTLRRDIASMLKQKRRIAKGAWDNEEQRQWRHKIYFETNRTLRRKLDNLSALFGDYLRLSETPAPLPPSQPKPGYVFAESSDPKDREAFRQVYEEILKTD